MITLHNVTDIRTGKFHSVVRIKERLAKWFVSYEQLDVVENYKEFIHHEPTTETPEEE